jgi:hypothetical protein
MMAPTGSFVRRPTATWATGTWAPARNAVTSGITVVGMSFGMIGTLLRLFACGRPSLDVTGLTADAGIADANTERDTRLA